LWECGLADLGIFDGGVLWGCKAYGSKTKKRRKRDIR
jgi:hypothetical protein